MLFSDPQSRTGFVRRESHLFFRSKLRPSLMPVCAAEFFRVHFHPFPCFTRSGGLRELSFPRRRWLCSVTECLSVGCFRPSGVYEWIFSDNGAAPERVDFSKIKTSIPIPNLIEVQKKSYERFLQMDLLPNEREDIGLQTVFNSVFPISDFRGVSELEFVDYSIGNWECKCGNLKGLHHLRSTCRNPVRRDHPHRPVPRGRRPVPALRHVQQERRHVLQ